MGNIVGKLFVAKHKFWKVNCNAMSEKLDISFLPFGYITHTFSIYKTVNFCDSSGTPKKSDQTKKGGQVKTVWVGQQS